MKISVIVPTYNEEARIGTLIDYLISNKGNSDVEIIIVDGGSKDNTVNITKTKKVKCEVVKLCGRASQMNQGAKVASGDVLYFLHADTFPPLSYTNCIKESILSGYTSGCCAYNFDSNRWPLKINSFFTQFNGLLSGGGDQTLYVTKSIFEKMGGFNPDYIIMEDFEFSKRLKAKARFKVIKSRATVSDRKYKKNSYLRVSAANLIAMLMFWFKAHPQKINTTYKSLIRY